MQTVSGVTAPSMPSTPVLKHDLWKGSSVAGVTSLGNEFFVLCAGNIAVHNISTFALLRVLALPEAGRQLYGLASCARNACLYVPDFDKHVVHRISLSAGNAVTSWPVAGSPTGISVNNACNEIVIYWCANRIHEYTTSGTKVREIRLPSGITKPWYALQLPSNKFLVSHEDNEVCLIGSNGSIEQRYGSMNFPVRIVVDKHGSILVADRYSKRILALDQSLSRGAVLPLPIVDGQDQQMNGPWALYLDESRDRMYVGEYEGRRLLVLRM